MRLKGPLRVALEQKGGNLPIYTKKSHFPFSAKTLFDWHEKEGAFERLTPPWEKVELLRRDPSLEVGSELHLKLKKGPLFFKWIAKHTEYSPTDHFTDVQIKGPFRKWIHYHSIQQISEKRSILEDRIDFIPPFGLRVGKVEEMLDQMFNYRHAQLRNDLEALRHSHTTGRNIGIINGEAYLTVPLASFLRTAGHRVALLKNIKSISEEKLDDLIYFNPWKQNLDQLQFSSHPPKNLISIIQPEDREKEIPSYEKGEHIVVNTGHLLTSAGGLLPRVVLFFKLGLGVIGEGDSFSWIDLDSFIYRLHDLILDEKRGKNCFLAPFSPISPSQLTNTLSAIFECRCVYHPPKWSYPIWFGKSATQLFSRRNESPHPPTSTHRGTATLEEALRHTLGKKKSDRETLS